MSVAVRPRAAVETRYVDRAGRVLRVVKGDGKARLQTGRAVPGAALLGTTRKGSRGTSSSPTSGAIRHVVINELARQTLLELAYDGTETGGGCYGIREGDTLWITHVYEQVVPGSATTSSMRLDVEAMADMAERLAEGGVGLLGDWHVHPRSFGIADPSQQDLRSWNHARKHIGHDYWLGVILTRDHDSDSAWLAPRATATVVRTTPDGGVTCDLLDVERAAYFNPTTPKEQPSWRLV